MPEQQTPPQVSPVPHPSEPFGSVRNDAEPFGNFPHNSETVGNIPKPSETFRAVPKHSERKESHTLTVREVARLFEAAGVARTERSIVNWCQLNLQGIARLDCYFDPNERKYFITPASVESAIAEEKAKAAKNQVSSEPVGTVQKESETSKDRRTTGSEENSLIVMELKKEVRDLQIATRVKDGIIDRLNEERDNFFTQLLEASHKIGELETRLLQLQAPKAK